MDSVPATLDAVDARLLNLVQQSIPFVHRPFDELGKRAGVSEQQCLERLRSLRDERKVIRQISAIFDTAALGYASSLVAAKFDPERLETGAAIISAHPGVSHNYERNHEFNLWYTLAVPPDSKVGLMSTIDRLRELSGALAMRALPTLRLFKIGVQLNLEADSSSESPATDAPPAPTARTSAPYTEADRAAAAGIALTDADRRLIVALQENLELVPEPFNAIAVRAGCDLDQLLDACRRFETSRQMRRFAAVLRHRQAGFSANVMGVWKVPVAEIEAVGQAMAGCPQVSHCYQRPAYDDWPYSIYTMIHGKSREECLRTLEGLQVLARGAEYRGLWSVREFKKVRVRYFTPETAQWEQQFAPAAR